MLNLPGFLTSPSSIFETGTPVHLATISAALRRLDFEAVSTRRFPCLRLAREAVVEERARIAVGKAIRRALARINEADPVIG